MIILLITTGLVACTTDQYSGEERTVLEGQVNSSNDNPVDGLIVSLYPVFDIPEDGNIRQLETMYLSNPISSVKIDNSGKISLSFPKHEKTDVYCIEIKKDYTTKYYGYISRYNTVNHYINVGTLIF